jgi:hypothetical protein
LGIKEKDPIVRVNPNGWHFWLGGNQFKAELRTYNVVAKYFLPFFAYEEILKEDLNLRFKDNPERYAGFLHFNQLERSPSLPTIFLDTLPTKYSESGDGYTTYGAAGKTWAQTVAAAEGINATYNISELYLINDKSWVSGTVYALSRVFLAFDTSALPSGASCSAANVSLNLHSKTGDDTNACITLGSQASTSEIVVADYNNIGATEFASRVEYATWTADAHSAFALNASGLAAIVDGYTKFAIRGHRDVDDSDPGAGTKNLVFHASEETGTAKDPKIDITYTVPIGGSFLFNFI